MYVYKSYSFRVSGAECPACSEALCRITKLVGLC
jgi:hypothetical protein